MKPVNIWLKLRIQLWSLRWLLLITWLMSAPLQVGYMKSLIQAGYGWALMLGYGGTFVFLLLLLWRQGSGVHKPPSSREPVKKIEGEDTELKAA